VRPLAAHCCSVRNAQRLLSAASDGKLMHQYISLMNAAAKAAVFLHHIQLLFATVLAAAAAAAVVIL
jgi:hypothetical protein